MNKIIKISLWVVGMIIAVVLAGVIIISFDLNSGFGNWLEKLTGQVPIQSADSGIYVKGVLVVGFKKDVSQTKAEQILNNFGLKFQRTDEVNMGMKFDTETGEKFVVKVPAGEEQPWLDKILKISEVKSAGRYVNPDKVLVD